MFPHYLEITKQDLLTLLKFFDQMLHTIQIDDSNSKAKALLEYLKTLDFVRVDKNDIPTWQKEQLDIVLEEHKNGTIHYTDWNEAKKNIFAKYNAK